MRNLLRSVSLAGAFFALAVHIPASSAEPSSTMNRQQLQVSPGDVIVQQNKNGTWSAIKILQVDAFPDGTSTAHCMSYAATQGKPTAASLPTLQVHVWHAPILASSFGS